jgi:hypothetical protein
MKFLPFILFIKEGFPEVCGKTPPVSDHHQPVGRLAYARLDDIAHFEWNQPIPFDKDPTMDTGPFRPLLVKREGPQRQGLGPCCPCENNIGGRLVGQTRQLLHFKSSCE